MVKPHNATHGKNVHVGIDSWKEFVDAFERVAGDHGQVLVEKFHTGVEHRCLVVNNKLVAATRRRPASVEGVGSSIIEELVTVKNRRRGKVHKRLGLGDREQQYLAKHGLSFGSVPAEGDRIYLTGASKHPRWW